jgi:SAM-dependent methyltransferase
MHADWAIERTANSPTSTALADRREVRNVSRALAHVPSGAAVLDIPCGSGLWLELMAKRGYRITCVDPSEIALTKAARQWEEIASSRNSSAPKPAFVLGQPLQTKFPARHFDAVLCTGFFDRLSSSDLRIEALRELRRISRGPVIVSFCNAFALGALQLGAARKRVDSGRRIPVPVWAFLNDLRRAGLNPVERHAVLWGISPLWHIVSVPAAGRASALLALSRTGIAKAA